MERQAHIRVECVSKNGQEIPEFMLEHGQNELIVPLSTLEIVKSMTEELGLASAEARYEEEVADWAEKNNTTDTGLAPWSVSKAFYIQNRREPGCLRNLEIIKDDLPPRLDPQAQQVAAVAQAITGQSAPTKRKSKDA